MSNVNDNVEDSSEASSEDTATPTFDKARHWLDQTFGAIHRLGEILEDLDEPLLIDRIGLKFVEALHEAGYPLSEALHLFKAHSFVDTSPSGCAYLRDQYPPEEGVDANIATMNDLAKRAAAEGKVVLVTASGITTVAKSEIKTGPNGETAEEPWYMKGQRHHVAPYRPDKFDSDREVIKSMILRQRDDEQGGYPDRVDGVWTFASTPIYVYPNELDALMKLVDIVPDEITPLGTCSDCKFSFKGYPRVNDLPPCCDCLMPRMSKFEPAGLAESEDDHLSESHSDGSPYR